jgi:DNA-binding MarR family transcriptional regulator
MNRSPPTSGEVTTGNTLDASVQKLLGKIVEAMPDADATALEAHLTLHRANNVYEASLDLLMASYPLSKPRFNLLKVMYQNDPRPLSISQVAGALLVSLPSALRMVGILEAEGWIRTTKSAADRRVTYVCFSDDGRQRFEKLLPSIVEIWEDLWSGLSHDERTTLSYLLGKLRHNLLMRYIGEEGLIAFRAKRLADLRSNGSE